MDRFKDEPKLTTNGEVEPKMALIQAQEEYTWLEQEEAQRLREVLEYD